MIQVLAERGSIGIGDYLGRWLTTPLGACAHSGSVGRPHSWPIHRAGWSSATRAVRMQPSRFLDHVLLVVPIRDAGLRKTLRTYAAMSLPSRRIAVPR